MQGSVGFPILTWITFLPILGMLITWLIPSGKDERSKEVSNMLIRWTTVIVTFIQLILAVIIFLNYNNTMTGINQLEGFQFVEKVSWIKASLILVLVATDIVDWLIS